MEHIYQVSDLATDRLELLATARAGVAQIRDKDGTGLVMLQQSDFNLLTALREQLSRFVSLEAAFQRPRAERRVNDYGHFAWLAPFDDDDQMEFRREYVEALAKGLSTDSTEPAEMCVRDWRMTARALGNEKVRKVLTSPGHSDVNFEQVNRPERD